MYDPVYGLNHEETKLMVQTMQSIDIMKLWLSLNLEIDFIR